MHKPEEAAGFFHLIFKIWKKILENGQDEEITPLELEEACEMLKKIYETLVELEGLEACSEINQTLGKMFDIVTANRRNSRHESSQNTELGFK